MCFIVFYLVGAGAFFTTAAGKFICFDLRRVHILIYTYMQLYPSIVFVRIFFAPVLILSTASTTLPRNFPFAMLSHPSAHAATRHTLILL